MKKKSLFSMLLLLLLNVFIGNAQTAQFTMTTKGIGDIKVGAKI